MSSSNDQLKKGEDDAFDILMEKQEPEMDEDGYAVGDPYSEAAKMIDRK